MPEIQRRETVSEIQPTARSAARFDDRGFILGADFLLVSSDKAKVTATNADRARLLTLLAIGYRQPLYPGTLSHIDAAAKHWSNGDKALATIRLIHAGLPHLDDPTTADRLRRADWLLDQGLSPDELLIALDLGPGCTDLHKHQYHPDQPRVPAGNGRDSGRWVAFWQAITTWLDEPVPEYDLDTGTQVGTRTRAKAIATNPISIGIVGAAALAASEAVLAGGAVALAGETTLEGATAASVEAEGGIAINSARGMASEARVLREMGLVRNTRAVVTAEGRAVPDALNDVQSLEIKDSLRVSYTRQIRIETRAAARDGQQSVLVTGERTYVTQKVLRAFDEILRRPDLGPK